MLDNHSPLMPPSAPFAHGYGGSAASSSSSLGLAPPSLPAIHADSTSNLSLSVNYLPSKFGAGIITNDVGPRRRHRKGLPGMPKRGGGVDAFRTGEARIGKGGDEDYDGIDDPRGLMGKGRRMKWTRFKWILFVVNTLVSFFLFPTPHYQNANTLL
jgi:hypothetical protein